MKHQPRNERSKEELIQIARNDKISVYRPQKIIEDISQESLLKVEKLMKQHPELSVVQFLRFFCFILKTHIPPSDQFYLLYGLLCLFKELCRNYKKSTVSFSEISSFITQKMPVFDQQVIVKEKFLPLNLDISKKDKSTIVAPQVQGKLLNQRQLLQKTPCQFDKFLHKNRCIAQACYSSQNDQLMTIDLPSNQIRLIDKNFNLIRNISSQLEISKGQSMISYLAWSESQGRLGAILGNYSLSFWAKQDNYRFEVNIPLPGDNLSNPYVILGYMQSMKVWYTIDNRPVVHILSSKSFEPRAQIKNPKMVKEKSTQKILSLEMYYQRLLCVGFERKVFLISLESTQVLTELASFNTSITSMVFSQTYQALFVSSFNNYFKAYELTEFCDLTEKGKFQGHKHQIVQLGILQTKPVVLSLEQNWTLKVWDIRDFTCYQTFSILKNISYAQILSVNGGVCFVGSKLYMYRWIPESHAIISKGLIYEQRKSEQKMILLSSVNKNILMVSNKNAKLFSYHSGCLIKMVKVIYENQDEISFAFVNQPRRQLYVSNDDGNFIVYETETLGKLFEYKYMSSPIYMNYFQKEDLLVMSSAMGEVRISEYRRYQMCPVKRTILNKEQRVKLVRISALHDIVLVIYDDDEISKSQQKNNSKSKTKMQNKSNSHKKHKPSSNFQKPNSKHPADDSPAKFHPTPISKRLAFQQPQLQQNSKQGQNKASYQNDKFVSNHNSKKQRIISFSNVENYQKDLFLLNSKQQCNQKDQNNNQNDDDDLRNATSVDLFFYTFERAKPLSWLNLKFYKPQQKLISLEIHKTKKILIVLTTNTLYIYSFHKDCSPHLTFTLKYEFTLWQGQEYKKGLTQKFKEFCFNTKEPLISKNLLVLDESIVITSTYSCVFCILKINFVQISNMIIDSATTSLQQPTAAPNDLDQKTFNYNPYRISNELHNFQAFSQEKDNIAAVQDRVNYFNYINKYKPNYVYTRAFSLTDSALKIGNVFGIYNEKKDLHMYNLDGSVVGVLNYQITLPKMWELYCYQNQELEDIGFVLDYMQNEMYSKKKGAAQQFFKLTLNPDNNQQQTISKLKKKESLLTVDKILKNVKQSNNSQAATSVKKDSTHKRYSLRQRKLLLQKQQEQKQRLQNFIQHQSLEQQQRIRNSLSQNNQANISQTLDYFSINHNTMLKNKGIINKQFQEIRLLEMKLNNAVSKDSSSSNTNIKQKSYQRLMKGDGKKVQSLVKKRLDEFKASENVRGRKQSLKKYQTKISSKKLLSSQNLQPDSPYRKTRVKTMNQNTVLFKKFDQQNQKNKISFGIGAGLKSYRSTSLPSLKKN